MALLTLSDGTQIDPSKLDSSPPDPAVFKLAQTIKGLEGGDYNNRSGDAGSSAGAYQWNNDNKPLKPGELPSHWKNAAAQYLKDPNAPMTPENQNYVAYQQIKAYKEQGRSPEEIDALWNGAHKDPTTGMYVHNAPERQAKFRAAILGEQTQTQPDAQGYVTSATIPNAQQGTPQTAPKEQGFIEGTASDLGKRAQEGLGALGDVIPALQGKGKQNILSDILQVGGAIGGAVGDVTNRTLENIPIVGSAVKGIENLVGQGVGALAQTDTGKAVIKSVSDWADKHPELAKDIGAGFNIVTAIPILRGLGVVKNVAMDATAQALKGVAEKGALKDLTAAASRTISGRRALAETPDALKTIVDERALPDIEGGKYATKEASAKLDGAISHADDATDAILQKTTVNGAKPTVDLTALRNQALASAKKELEGTSNYKSVVNKINELFDTAEASDRAITIDGQKFLTLEDANYFKRQARKGLKWDDTIGQDAGFHAGQSYMKGIEDIATKNNLGDVHDANQATARLIQAQNMLRHIEGKPVKMGLVGGLIQDTAMAGGEIAGNMTGIPLAGAFLGREGGGFVGRKLTGLRTGLLNRTGSGAVRTPLNIPTLKKATQGLVSTRLQNITKRP